MKYPVIALFAALLFMAGCTKDSVTNEEALKNQAVETRQQNLVTICHHTGNGSYNPIQVNQNAVPAHLAHGDYLPDADGDGYSAIGACTGSMDDCDDNNANVHPGAEEICDNGIDDDCDGITDCNDCPSVSEIFNTEFLNYFAPFEAYYDSEVNNCEGFVDGAAIFDEFFAAYAVEFPVEEEGTVKIVAFFWGGGTCFYVVGENMTEEEYQSALSALRAVIEANPGTQNYCDGFSQNPANPAPALARSREQLAKVKQALPAKVRERMGKK